MTFVGRDAFDLEDHSAIGALIRSHDPIAVINAAAYTAVDRAESEAEAAYAVNRDAPGAMAEICAAWGAPFVHFSTDYVFNGSLDRPYVETDEPDPRTVYGASKLAGERAVAAAGGAAIVLRTSWVYSTYGLNFVKTMLRLAGERSSVNVVADQIGCPTWARDCAEAAVNSVDALLKTPERAGLYHLAGLGDASWADLAEAVFEESARRGGPAATVHRISTAEYPTPATRPANSRLDCRKVEDAQIWRRRPWRESLATCISQMEL